MADHRDAIVTSCPYCASSELFEALQEGYGGIYATSNMTFGSRCPLYHLVCRNCGTIVRSYVKEPEKILKRKDRKKN